jgi:hypothetical protein
MPNVPLMFGAVGASGAISRELITSAMPSPRMSASASAVAGVALGSGALSAAGLVPAQIPLGSAGSMPESMIRQMPPAATRGVTVERLSMTADMPAPAMAAGTVSRETGAGVPYLPTEYSLGNVSRMPLSNVELAALAGAGAEGLSERRLDMPADGGTSARVFDAEDIDTFGSWIDRQLRSTNSEDARDVQYSPDTRARLGLPQNSITREFGNDYGADSRPAAADVNPGLDPGRASYLLMDMPATIPQPSSPDRSRAVSDMPVTAAGEILDQRLALDGEVKTLPSVADIKANPRDYSFSELVAAVKREGEDIQRVLDNPAGYSTAELSQAIDSRVKQVEMLNRMQWMYSVLETGGMLRASAE